jgi:hypothetical protein
MKESLALARLNNKAAVRADVLALGAALVKSPVAAGVGLLLANHAIYKSGWYKADTLIQVSSNPLFGLFGWKNETITQGESAVNMHDSIALFIMAASIAAAIAPAGAGAVNASSLLKAVTS